MSKTKQTNAALIGKRPTNVDKRFSGIKDNTVQRDHIVDAAINAAKLAEDVKDHIFNNNLSITAYATGGQANATQLSKGLNIITTCATRLDSAKLPSTFNVGDRVYVTNNGDKTANIYPYSGDNIEGLAADTPIPLLPGNTIEFIGTTQDSGWSILFGFEQTTNNIDLTSIITLTAGAGSLSSVNFAKGRMHYIFNNSGGYYEFDANINVTLSATARTTVGLTIAGITSVNYFQKISFSHFTTAVVYGQYMGTSSGQITCEFASTTTTGFSANVHRVRLASQTLI